MDVGQDIEPQAIFLFRLSEELKSDSRGILFNEALKRRSEKLVLREFLLGLKDLAIQLD
jgi:hypothetical protein